MKPTVSQVRRFSKQEFESPGAAMMAGRQYTVPTNGNIKTCLPSDTLYDVSHTMRSNYIGAVIVADENNSVRGIISERDLIRAMNEHGQDGKVQKDIAEKWMTGLDKLIV